MVYQRYALKLSLINLAYIQLFVTDSCGNKASNSINITDKDFEPQDLVYANVFYPDGLNIKAVSTPEDSTKFKQARQYDLTFGPVNKPEYCIENITKYEFFVYNRFGQIGIWNLETM